MKVSKNAYNFARTLVYDHEVFSARIPFCKNMEEILVAYYSKPSHIVREALLYLQSHKTYREYEQQNYPSYDLEGNPCKASSGVALAKKPLVIPHRSRTEALHKPVIHIKHSRHATTTKNSLERLSV